jgi:hypothetical protein
LWGPFIHRGLWAAAIKALALNMYGAEWKKNSESSFYISGFGHLAPETWQGKLFCIFYSLLGVPINGILIGSLGTFFGSKVNS